MHFLHHSVLVFVYVFFMHIIAYIKLPLFKVWDLCNTMTCQCLSNDMAFAKAPTLLGFLYWVVGILQQFGNDRLNIFTYIACLSQGGTVTDSKGNIQTLSQSLCQQGFPWKAKHQQKSLNLSKCNIHFYIDFCLYLHRQQRHIIHFKYLLIIKMEFILRHSMIKKILITHQIQ